MSLTKKVISSLTFTALPIVTMQAADIKGIIKDQQTGEPLIGAVVTIEGKSETGSVTDINGQYTFSGLAAGTYKVVVKYIGYKTTTASITATDKKGVYTLDIAMGADQQALGEVVITGMAMKNTEEAMTEAAKNSQVVIKLSKRKDFSSASFSGESSISSIGRKNVAKRQAPKIAIQKLTIWAKLK